MPPVWNLSDLYRGTDDPEIDSTLSDASKKAGDFAKKYRGKITGETSSMNILKSIQEYESILNDVAKPGCYAYLVYSVNSIDPKNAALLQKVKKKGIEINEKLIFFELAIVNLPDAKLQALIYDKKLLNYRHFLQKIFKQKPHRLTEVEEKIFNDKYLTSASALNRLFDEELAEQKYDFKNKKLSESQILDFLHSPNVDDRKLSASAFSNGLKKISRRLTFVTNMLLEDKAIGDKYFKYNLPEDSRHLENETDKKSVDAMVKVITDNYPLVHEYYNLKKKVLNLKNIYDYDRYAPITNSRRKFTYAESRDIILNSLKFFSPRFEKIAKEFFDNNWIDARPEKNKRGGAYCMYITPSFHPYIFSNFHNSIGDIETLTHELGHGIHATLARKQTYLNFDWPLTLSETASVFAEMILFNNLKKNLQGREKLGFLMNRIESIFSTVFRQTAMFLFERDVHAMRKKGELATTDISKAWRKRQTEMFGQSVILTPNYDLWWSYIPHFKHTPFYVYAYSFGELLTLSLYAQYMKDGQNFIPKYINFLESGGSKTPGELLQPFNVKLSDPKFWSNGIGIIKDMVNEAQEMHSSLLHKRDISIK